MTGMKLLVGVCTEEQQSLIVQKAYHIISSMLPLPLKSVTDHILGVDELFLSHSIHGTALVGMLSSVIIGLRPQTPVPDMMVMINLLTAYLLTGQMPAAYALASMFNKYLHNPDFSHEKELDRILDVILERCFSAVLASRESKISHSSGDTSDYVNFSDGTSGNILSINILSGLAWIGKGLLMRGDEKVKDISMFLLKCLCSDETSASIQSDQEENYVSDSSGVTLATSAAGAFHVIMSDSEVCLNKKFHSRIKPLYKQRFFSILMPIFLSKIKESTAIITR
jgi:DNA repair/transcription protein MET18/MMS19